MTIYEMKDKPHTETETEKEREIVFGVAVEGYEDMWRVFLDKEKKERAS